LHWFKRARVEVAEMSERLERFKRVREGVGKGRNGRISGVIVIRHRLLILRT
jgi:hypothetical protein